MQAKTHIRNKRKRKQEYKDNVQRHARAVCTANETEINRNDNDVH